MIKSLLRKTKQQAKAVVLAALLKQLKQKRVWEAPSPLLSIACLDALSKEVYRAVCVIVELCVGVGQA